MDTTTFTQRFDLNEFTGLNKQLKEAFRMEPIKLNLVDDPDLLLNKGDAWQVQREDGILQLIMVCPGCGHVSASAGNHKFNPETKTYTPSIVHNTDLGGCGWHGWLKDGVFTEV